ncbi:MAG: hypothetical protein WA374_03100 [Acidobacteriaceae bacterium]
MPRNTLQGLQQHLQNMSGFGLDISLWVLTDSHDRFPAAHADLASQERRNNGR